MTTAPQFGTDTPASLIAALSSVGPVSTDETGACLLSGSLTQWPTYAAIAHEHGAWLAWLTGTDLSDFSTRLPGDAASGPIELAACFETATESVVVTATATPSVQLPSLSQFFGNATWYEAEISHLLGYRFRADNEPDAPKPLRRAFPLTPRQLTPWPGAESGRRRVKVPGVNPNWPQPGSGKGEQE